MAGLVEYALTSVDDVKKHIDAAKDGRDDDLIISMINAFSETAQGRDWCNREFLIKSRTEKLSGPRKHFTVIAPPILESPAIELWNDPTMEYTNPSYKLSIYGQYDVNYANGLIRVTGDCKVGSAGSIRIVYTGGLFGQQTEIPMLSQDIPWALKNACEQQVVFWFKMRKNPGERQSDGQIGTNTFFNPTAILPNVAKTLLSYRRFD